MRCSQCDNPAVGVCPTCSTGQCERHLHESRIWYTSHPAITCVHRDRPKPAA